MKFGFRKPSFKKSFAARTSWKRAVRHNLGLKAPRGWGWLTNPKKAAYNRVYNRTTFGVGDLVGGSSRRRRGGSGASVEGEGGCAIVFVAVALFGVLVVATSFAGALAITAGLCVVAGILKVRNSRRMKAAALLADAEAERLKAEHARKTALALETRRTTLQARFGAEVAVAILEGRYWQGATSEMICEALGAPVEVRERVLKAKTKTTYCYRPIAKRKYGLKIYFENGVVVGWDE
jgi:hypothetical protein